MTEENKTVENVFDRALKAIQDQQAEVSSQCESLVSKLLLSLGSNPNHTNADVLYPVFSFSAIYRVNK